MPFTATGRCPSGRGERPLHSKWKVPFRAWRKDPSQQLEGALQGVEKGPFTANGSCPSGLGERALHSK